jgi:cysteine desulfurase
MRIYLDHNATTPLRPEVAEEVLCALRDFGNPSSVHAEGCAARARIERARERAAELLGAQSREIVFTSGATESNNTVLAAGLGGGAGDAPRRHLVISAAEHPSVAEPAARLEAAGARVTRVRVDADGLLEPAAVVDALEPDTALVSLLWANNETGVVLPLPEIAAALAARGVPLHVDATQAVGKLPVDLAALPVAFLSASAHKLNGPKGAGILFAREGEALAPLLLGGPQERLRRGGTENVAAIAGLGVACELARRELGARAARSAELRDRLWDGIAAKIPRARRNGSARHVLPNTLNVELAGAPAEVLVQALDLEGVAVSTGAACHSGSLAPSAVLAAMGRTPEQARASLRFSVGQGVDEAQIDRVLALLPDLVERARALEDA